MKGLIIYFSGTGNTKLAVEYLATKVKGIDFVLHDVNNKAMPDIDQYQIVGFATYAQAFIPPEAFQDFIKGLPDLEQKKVFVFNTYGLINGNTLAVMAELIKAKGGKVIAGFSLRMPESSPIMLQYKISSANAPSMNGMDQFHKEIEKMEVIFQSVEEPEEVVFPQRNLYHLLNGMLSTNSLASIGSKMIERERCTVCGLCERSCPYGAIVMKEGLPFFEEEKCKSCFICYNRCPSQAIYSKKHRGTRYHGPSSKVKKKLLITKE